MHVLGTTSIAANRGLCARLTSAERGAVQARGSNLKTLPYAFLSGLHRSYGFMGS